MADVNVNVAYASFPSQTATEAEKASDEFGLRVGQSIQYEWFRKDGSSCRYYSQWRDFHRLRLYARGEQPVGKYKNELAIDGDLSFMNLDWTPVPILPKFVDIVVNGMSDRLFKVKAVAQDAMSAKKKNDYQSMIEGQMAAKEPLLKLQEAFNVETFTMPADELPEDSEEMALHMQLKYKPAIEIANEQAIDTIFENNHYDDTRRRMDYDMAVLGIAAAKHEFLPGAGVKVEYVDPANLIYSYTEDRYFKDCFYWGEVKTVPLTELYKIKPGISKDEVEKISQSSTSWYDYYNVRQFYNTDLFYKDTCTLLYFNYKTTKKFTYKKKVTDSGNDKVIEKGDDFNPPEEMMEEGRFEKITKTIDVWYEGIMVMGTEILLKWELAENMVRPKSATQHAIPNYVACAPRIYKGAIESLVRRMIPFADLIQITHLKLQQVVSRVVPDGVYIDADGLNEVDLGTGAAYNPEDALRLYFQTGSVIGRSYTQEGEFNNARVPIQQLTSNSGASKLQMLIGNYNHYLDMIRAVTGLNEVRDGSTPDPRALVGVQKLAALNSNTATRHILDGSLFITKSLAEALSYRVSDILEYADFRDEFISQIGNYSVDMLEDIKQLYIYDFGVFIEVSPDEEERAQLEQNIQIALSKGDINLEDAIDIREIKNIKLANQLLKVKRKRNIEREQQQAMMAQQMNAKTQMETQQMAAQSAMQKIQLESQAKIQEEQAKAAFAVEKMRSEAAIKAQLMEQEFQYNLQLQSMRDTAIADRESAKEKGKSDRISQQSTEQSKLITQRKNNLPPISFESSEDSLDGFGLEEFTPR